MARRAKTTAQQNRPRPKYEYMLKCLEDGTIEKWVNVGLTNKQICSSLHVNINTFSQWIEENPQLKSVLANGKRNVIADTWGALYKRSIGYDYYEETTSKKEVFVNGKKETVMEVHRTKKHLPPDPKSAQLLLVNFTRQLQLYGGGMPEFCLNNIAVELQDATKDKGNLEKIEKGLMAVFGENNVIATVEAENVKDSKE